MSVVYLATSRLSVGYSVNNKKNFLFQDLNLALPAGQLVCFMGPNGIGKSSLIRTLAGLQKALSGQVLINHTTTNDNPSKQISVVLTDKIHASNMTVYDLVAFGRYPYLDWSVRLNDEDRIIIERSIAMVHIRHLADQKLFELSDGQLQMVMIARALAQDTPIILLDEPTAHLDLNNRVEIMKLLRTLSRSTKKSILVATHELDLALQMADLIWLSGLNRNIISGIPEDLVLNGSFDEIFQFKGFDLKTGRVQHEAQPGKSIQLSGEGYEYLWTRNALERVGWEVSELPRPIQIAVEKSAQSLRWRIRKQGLTSEVDSIDKLINSI